MSKTIIGIHGLVNHKSYGYLRTPEVTNALVAFL